MWRLRLTILCVLFAGALPAQDCRGSLFGRVTDATGAVVPGVSITVVNEATNVASTTRTNEEGNYLVPLLEPGAYSVTSEAAGFKKLVRNGIAVRTGDKHIMLRLTRPTFPDALDEFRRGVKELGLKGFKLSPVYQKFHPMDSAACRIYAQAEEWGIPLIFHTATAQAADVPLKYADPVPFDDVAYAFPNLKIIMAHLAHPWQRECIVMARKHPNVYMDISANFYRPWMLYNALLFAWEWSQTEKIFFATDWPVTTSRETMAGLRNLNRFAQGGNPRVPDEVIEGIIYRDSLGILGIQA